jgi:hypothetical protein
MKKIYLILSFIGLTVTAFGQGYTATSFGYLGGQSSAVLSERDSVKINISGGSVVATNQFYTLQLDRAQAMTGFPPMVSYFPDVFSQEVFISKGYFADYVQLKWTIKSQQDRISRIKVYRKPLGFNGDSLLIATLADDDFSYRDEYAEKGVLYKYTVFAEGIADDLRLPFINIVEGVGFAFPFGTVAGSVAYEGGTAVAGVQILAETDGSLGGKSISLNGTDAYLSLDHGTNDDELDLEKGFTLQLWAQYQGSTRGTIFSKGGQYELAYEPGNLSFTVGDVTLDMPYNHPVDSFFHVSAVYDPLQGLKLYVQESDYVMDSAIAAIPTPPAKARDVIYFGRSSAEDNYYGGIIDEIRLWNKALSYEEVHSNFSRYLSGSEANLSGYWKLNSGNGNGFYDFSREGFEFHENHGVIWRGAWSGTVPDKSQLAYRGVTDAKGNFVVRGFPYETAGSQYTFTPIFGVHEFEPAQQLRFVGDGAAIFNGVNFKDVSSFPVSGTIKYRHSSFPVEGISLLIDGNAAIDQEGLLITSDNLGQFTIDVPIGFHSIRLSKNGHVFEEEGRFPPRTVPDKIPTYDFQQPLAGLEFIDNSLVKFVGKVVGGPVEAEKPRGFGLSKSNIGIAQITITTEKGYDISTSDSTVVYNGLPDYAERDIDNYSEFKNKFVNVFPDPETGEFVTYLLPEKHVITGVTAGDYVFGDEHKVTVNLETSFEQTDTYDELVMELRADGTPLPGYISIDSSKYDYFTSEEILDTTYVYGGKNFSYEKDKDFILRVKPGIEVVNADGLELFGESLYTYEDELRTDEITLIDGSNNYTFGHPVFSQQRRYNMFISVFEEYTNGNTGASDRVPVKDGKVEIVNDFGINRDAETLTLDDKGKARYLFAAGFPELNKNFVDGNLSFTRPFALTAVTGETGNIRTTWHEADPLRGIVFGGVPQGNNFVTTGPNQIITVLRDPPGSNSRAYLEKGKTMTQTVTWESSLSGEVSANLKLSLGYKNETWAGVGAGVINEVEATADLDLGIKVESEFKENGESVNTITTTKTWSTSEDPSFVSAPGDVFVGNSTNIVYGTAVSIQPIPVTDEECVTGDCDGIVNGDFQLGPRRGLRMNPEFGTMFIYTQSHIEKVLIPNLIEIRNSMLAYSPNPASVTATTDVIYLSLVAPDDERYGSANYNMAHWGDAATIDVGVGPSYKILIPSVVDSATVSDTIAYFNKQIEGWIRTLENNEKAKVNASLSENISFDGGTSYSSSETVESTNSYAFDFSVGVTASMATSVGIAVNGIGAEVSMSMSAKMGRSDGGGTSVSNLTTYAYELADQNSTGINAGSTGDYYSIDVKTPSDGFGPVFVTRAGVSSCPYEGESKTKYFEPDQHVLNFATIQAEKPELTIINPLVANVPSNREAVLNLELKNNSENGADVYYVLSVEDQTNFNGAILSIDGAVLTGDGRVFYVPAGQAVSKILKVAKGSDDINDYENIDLKISSQCDANIYDIQPFSVYFQPGCSDVNLVSPVDLWVINTNTTPEETQNIIFNDYDLQNSQFRYAKFQYKASSSSQWLTNMIFYNPMLVNQTEYDGLDEPKAWLSETGATSYPWDMSDLPDRKFDVRVVSVCELAPGVTAETPTDTHTGVKDVKRPVAFGAPQPADGVLSANDEIMIQFDETIEAGLLTPFNFSVRGVLNSAEIRHSTSINFDGVNDYVKIGDGLNLTDRSFTVEFWIKREDFAKEQVVYSKGFSSSDVFELGFTADNKFFVNAGGQRATSVNTYTDLAWNHFAVVYSQSSGLADVYMNDQYVMSQAAINTAFTGEGSIVIGKSQITNDRHFVGNLHELRIWTKTRQLGDIYAKMSKTLTGSEVGLVGYWPMDEAIGIRAFDKARFRHAILFADWEVSPKGNAFAFDGVNDHVELNTASTVIVTSEMDFTIEFWFNGSPNQTNAIMFSSGKGDGTDIFNDPANSLSIGFDDAGLLYFINDGEILTVSSGNYLDDNWHHFAFTLLRQSNANILVDGVQKATRASSNFGGLSGASMWIGARGFKVNAVDKSFDHYFSGAIDEFRVWNLGMKSDQINLNINSRLIGDEIGLVGYYPFEYYETVTGVKIMNSTLEDQWINPYGENGGVATSFGGADFSDDTPNIKDARPVDKVDFDWAVNGDKIIITPAESFKALIEQTILEITVQNIEDLFENRLASPITWTAFVDRNQLKWDTDQIEARKEIYAPYSFTTDIVNFGGTETSFSIDNLPLWLSASPSSGVLSPVSSKTIKFTVNDGLNTGNYLEDVFLSSNFGYDEKLTIDLQVYSPEPDWDTNPFDFQFSMNLVAQLEIANILSSDVNDRVAAFVNNEIRGDVNLIYVEGLDLYEVFLDVYSNVESGETIELRVWDSDKGVEYRNALPQITFESNTIIGSPGNPDKIIAGDVSVQKISFNTGWNWSSVNINASSLGDVNAFMSGITAASGDQIKGIDKVDVYSEGIGWLGTLSSSGGLKNGPMYLFKLSNPGSVEVIGTQADAETSVTINSGWNWLGFIPRFNMNINEAFAFFNPASGDIIKSQFAFSVYDQNLGWIGSLRNMEPGKGYLFQSANSGFFKYPEASFLSSGRNMIDDNLISDFIEIDRFKYPYTMSVIAEFAEEVSTDLILTAYSGEELRGVMEPVNTDDGSVLYFMTVYGNMPEMGLTLKAFNSLSGEEFVLDQTITFEANNLSGKLSSPLQLTGLDKVNGVSGNLNYVMVYPNPFDENLEVYIPAMTDEIPRIVLTDIVGREMGQLNVLRSGNGWQASINEAVIQLSSGVYLINIYSGNEIKSVRVIKN